MLLRLAIADVLMMVIAPLLLVGVQGRPVPLNTPAHRLNIIFFLDPDRGHFYS